MENYENAEIDLLIKSGKLETALNLLNSKRPDGNKHFIKSFCLSNKDGKVFACKCKCGDNHPILKDNCDWKYNLNGNITSLKKLPSQQIFILVTII